MARELDDCSCVGCFRDLVPCCEASFVVDDIVFRVLNSYGLSLIVVLLRGLINWRSPLGTIKEYQVSSHFFSSLDLNVDSERLCKCPHTDRLHQQISINGPTY